MYQTYATDPQMRINGGIRRRLAPLMENSRRRIELMNSLLFSLPGTPVIYYGDEIGMGDNIYLGDRNGVRTPMQWTGDRNGGFSRADAARLYAPAHHRSGLWLHRRQRRSAGTRAVLAPQLDEADDRRCASSTPSSAAARSSSSRRRTARCWPTCAATTTDTILCVANLSRSVQPVELDLSRFRGMVPVEMLGQTEFPRIGEQPYFLSLGAYAFNVVSPAADRAGDHRAHDARDDRGASPTCRRSSSARSGTRCSTAPSATLIERDLLGRVSAAAAVVPGTTAAFGALQGLGSAPPRPGADLRDDRRSRARRFVRRARRDGAAAVFRAARAWRRTRARKPVQERVPARGRRAGHRRPERRDLRRAGTTRASPITCSQRSDGTRGRDAAASASTGRSCDGVRAHERARVDGPRPTEPATQPLALKLFRRVEPGVHPEIEITGASLGCGIHARSVDRRDRRLRAIGRVTSSIGMFTRRRQPCRGADRRLDARDGLVGPVVRPGEGDRTACGGRSRRLTAVDVPPAPVGDLIGPYLEIAATLGRRTADMHAALAADTDRSAVRAGTARARRSRPRPSIVRSHTPSARSPASTRRSVRRRHGCLPTPPALAQRVLEARRQLLDAIRSIATLETAAPKIRIHGDYRLGQVLLAEGDVYIQNVEGHVVVAGGGAAREAIAAQGRRQHAAVVQLRRARGAPDARDRDAGPTTRTSPAGRTRGTPGRRPRFFRPISPNRRRRISSADG